MAKRAGHEIESFEEKALIPPARRATKTKCPKAVAPGTHCPILIFSKSHAFVHNVKWPQKRFWEVTRRSLEIVTQAPNSRRSALISLLAYERPIEELRLALAEFEWDCPQPLVSLTRKHILIMLEKFLAGELTAEEVEAWADLVEARDDIEFPDEQVLDAISVLANPTINGVLDNQLANQLVSRISD